VWFFTDRKFFSPPMMTFLGYLLSITLSFFMQAYYGYTVGATTYLIYIILTLCISAGAIAVGIAMRKAPKREFIAQKHELKLTVKQYFILLAIQLVVFAVFIYDYNKVVGGISIAHLGETINRFRVASSYTGEMSLSFITNQLVKFTTAISFVALYYMAASAKFDLKSFLLTATQLLPSAAIQLLSGSRFQFLIYIVFFAIVFFYKKLDRKITLKTALFVGALGVGGLAIFSLSRVIVGRGQNQSVFAYIGHYFGKSIIAFDYYLGNKFTGPTYNPDRVFYGISRLLDKLGLYEIGNFHKPFVSINGVSMGNVYGGVYDYFSAFSFGGVVVFGLIFGALSMFSYYKATYKNSQKIDFVLILYAKICYAFLLDFYNGFFFQNLFSLNFLVEAVLIWFIIRFVLGETGDKPLFWFIRKGKTEKDSKPAPEKEEK
jgi:oligosaccharide repeat unit polymerase